MRLMPYHVSSILKAIRTLVILRYHHLPRCQSSLLMAFNLRFMGSREPAPTTAHSRPTVRTWRAKSARFGLTNCSKSANFRLMVSVWVPAWKKIVSSSASV